jgi:hypothetical protein
MARKGEFKVVTAEYCMYSAKVLSLKRKGIVSRCICVQNYSFQASGSTRIQFI